MQDTANVPSPRQRMRDQTIWRSSLVRIGRFRARPEEALFREVSPTQHYAVVFPGTALKIRFARHGSFVVDPTLVTFYNPHDEYRRDPIDPRGDVSTWISAAPEVLEELLPSQPRPGRGSPATLFARPVAGIDSRTFIQQRRLLQAVATEPGDLLAIEERALDLLARLIPAACGGQAGEERTLPNRYVRCALEFLAAHYSESHSVAEIAHAASCSPYHLCRQFKSQTGWTLHGYRLALRLRHGFDATIEGVEDLSRLAHELGFSSHSHFTASFRKMFGCAPRTVRERWE